MTRWLRTRAACEYTGYSASTLKRWRDDGLECSRPRGGVISYDRDELDRYMKRHRVRMILKRHNALHLVAGGQK